MQQNIHHQREVLEEDEYIAKLQKIIRRDFFPHRKVIQQQLRVLSDDAVFSEEAISCEEEEESKLTLDQFCEKYTSEDNASFANIMEKMKMNHQQRMLRRFGKVNGNDTIKALPTSSETKSIEYNKLNALMFYPSTEGIVQDNTSDASNYQSSNSKQIIYANTRFHSREEDLETPSSVTSTNTITDLGLDPASERIILSTLKKHGHFSKDKSMDAELKKLLSTSTSKLKKDVNSHYVHTPIIEPGKSDNEDDLIMTWGSIEGTPLPLNSSLNEPRFRVPETPKREQLSLALASKAAKSIRQRINAHTPGSVSSTVSSLRSTTPSHTPLTPQTTQERLSALSPAAQKLAQSLQKKKSSFSIFGGESPLSSRSSTHHEKQKKRKVIDFHETSLPNNNKKQKINNTQNISN
jgi:protein DGCR14